MQPRFFQKCASIKAEGWQIIIMSNIYNVRIEGNLDIKVLVASFSYEYEETFDHLKHAPLEYVAKYFHGGG